MVTQLGIFFAYYGLVAVGFILMLPAIAVLHVRHRLVSSSGAVLGTIAGTAAVVLGILAATQFPARPAALLAAGMWWWTIGKMWVQSGAMPRAFGFLTAGLGVLAVAGALWLPLTNDMLVVNNAAAGQLWTIVHTVTGAWLAILALMLLRTDEEA